MTDLEQQLENQLGCRIDESNTFSDGWPTDVRHWKLWTALVAAIHQRVEREAQWSNINRIQNEDHKKLIDAYAGHVQVLERELSELKAREGGKGTPTMKVFRLNEYDWWLAPDMETAIESCMKDCGYSREETVDKQAHELTFDEMGKLRFRHEDLGEMTFAQEYYRRIAAGMTSPDLFATTEI